MTTLSIVPLTQKTVLLVEDDLDLRDILQDLLETEGYDIVPAYDGRQALEYLRGSAGVAPERGPALVILDLMMPLVSGWEVLLAIRNDPALRAIPVIVVSAANQHHRPAGAAEYLRKPFSVHELMEAVHDRC